MRKLIGICLIAISVVLLGSFALYGGAAIGRHREHRLERTAGHDAPALRGFERRRLRHHHQPRPRDGRIGGSHQLRGAPLSSRTAGKSTPGTTRCC